VARLYTDGAFARSLKSRFTGNYRLNFHLAPPILGRRDAFTGQPVKSVFGPWMMVGFKVVARLKGLRGTAFDPFGYSAERRQERALIGAYKQTVASLLASLTAANHLQAVEIASVPEQIRGFGHVKNDSIRRAKSREMELLARFGMKAAAKSEAMAAE
jgi:indolepyruvate ferredoxin oxidoreductase